MDLKNQKIAGYSILAAIFVGLFIVLSKLVGFLTVFCVFLGVAAFYKLVAIAVNLAGADANHMSTDEKLELLMRHFELTDADLLKLREKKSK
ncbi:MULTISPECIES: hypothetical protein [Alteromonas]|jgi:hypothetical protein|uniref:hypothetical protein n=1 Tax=Alteromonas TaxID=226 RepID=UPI000C781221|nr:hypothetical protein [Alteromonas macleodii]AUI84840.1 hypothetical protein TE101_21000 [Alteromonas macleodii]CAI3970690.1 hypothetical protein EZ55_04232 [Alteromonas macleodii]VTP58241.1 hypothetical protein EZ55_04232 [Alteromonas macleodii]|tara:strand:- start:267 stop:542 length:276 start_codon:yes stop_codon:yes gene_type:complete